MNVKDRDALDHAIVKMRALLMAIKGADSISDQGEANSLEALADDTLRAFENLKVSIESEPTLRVA
jgi:hypothetical protein